MRTVSVIAVCLLLFSCKTDPSDFKSNAEGPANEIMVVMTESQRDGALGDSVRSVLGAAHPGLAFPEPTFSMDIVFPQIFSGYMRRHRNIFEIVIRPNAENKMHRRDGHYAYNQSYIRLEATDEKTAGELLSKNRNEIIDYYHQGEMKRYALNFRKTTNTVKNKIKEKFGFTIYPPADYNQVRRDEKDFFWFSAETPRTSKAIMIYTLDYFDQTNFQKEILIERRNEILQKYVWASDTAYVQTEDKVPVVSKIVEVNGSYGVTMQGYWKLEGGGFMGGPFTSLSILDTNTNQIIVLDSYIYAPEAKFDRVQYAREIEGIFSTFEYALTTEKIEK